jgi:hypothetical protein
MLKKLRQMWRDFETMAAEVHTLVNTPLPVPQEYPECLVCGLPHE